jgi:hypothetical protein
MTAGRSDKVVTAIVSLAACLATSGCLSPGETWREAGEGVEMPTSPPGADTRWLLGLEERPVDPRGLAMWAEAAEARVTGATVEGVVFQPRVDGGYGTGGDSMLFSGTALAGWCWKYAALGRCEEDRAGVLAGLRGLWWLTHAAGRGVLARCVFPKEREREFGWPEQWSGREFLGESPVTNDPLGGAFPAGRWYTRATRDQLTGLVLGLSVAWRTCVLDEPDAEFAGKVRAVVAPLVADVLAHLDAHGWSIRDAQGENDTGADDVDGLLKVGLLGLGWRTGVVSAEQYADEFSGWESSYWWSGMFDGWSNLSQYYAHNLRVHRSLAVWTLDDDPRRKMAVQEYAEAHWREPTRGHLNAWFALAWYRMSSDTDGLAEGVTALGQLMSKPTRLWSSPLAGVWDDAPPFTAVLFGTEGRWVLPVYLREPAWYWTWQDGPWEVGELPHDDRGERAWTGLDFFVPYWLMRASGFPGE